MRRLGGKVTGFRPPVPCVMRQRPDGLFKCSECGTLYTEIEAWTVTVTGHPVGFRFGYCPFCGSIVAGVDWSGDDGHPR